ncbi:KAP family P-loop domain containing protein [Candidatus Hepatoplasma crinochetorum Av]|uniref:KAP family P-loop domain containing protein n=1 Tax=Candidatus Hepatoplasma crinochetorum Av TaxID=1427984 RepID=W8GGB5_9MOLU|nr:P-loop NTPase fold protein [Candidatus Hepatoplasma crinochetorum]AHK22643.1 KAP family P-loop domain containing protein [Candidatus Hepatoplasma crinochetorum Av]
MEKIKDFIIPKGYSIDLIVKEDDHELINAGKIFINELEKEYEKYKENLNREYKNIEKYLNNNSVYFSNEKIDKKSPLTIIDAPWGSGKTFFIESLAKHIIDNNIKTNIFKNIIILDSWKYSNSKNIPDEIISELFYILAIKYGTKENNLKEKLKKFGRLFFNATVLSWANNFGKLDLEKIKPKEEKEIKNLLLDISNIIEPTLIVFDNIERIGKYSWEILKAIFKISQIDNFCFILPMNTKKLKENEYDVDNEYPIEKYIDIPFFKFKQDYLSFLKKFGFKNEEANSINKILNKEIEGQKLSIREVEQRFNKENIKEIENKYEKIKKIVNKIWGSVEEAKKYLYNDLEEFYLKIIELKNNYDEFKKIIIKKYSIKYSNNYENETNNLNLLVEKFYKYEWSFDYKDWFNDFNEVLKELKDYEKRDKNKIEKYEKDIKNKKIQIEKIKENISNLIKLNKEEEQKDLELINYVEIENFKNAINKHNKDIFNLNKEIRNDSINIENIKKKLINLNFYDNFKNLSDLSKKYKTNENNLFKNVNKYLINIFLELLEIKENLNLYEKNIFINKISEKILNINY